MPYFFKLKPNKNWVGWEGLGMDFALTFASSKLKDMLSPPNKISVKFFYSCTHHTLSFGDEQFLVFFLIQFGKYKEDCSVCMHAYLHSSIPACSFSN